MLNLSVEILMHVSGPGADWIIGSDHTLMMIHQS
jgi:hypothetical protein